MYAYIHPCLFQRHYLLTDITFTVLDIMTYPSFNIYNDAVATESRAVDIIRSRNTNGVPELHRTLSMPNARTSNQFQEQLRNLYFVDHVALHDSGDLVVWTLTGTPTQHIGLMRTPGARTQPCSVSEIDTVMRTGVYNMYAPVHKIVRVDFSLPSGHHRIVPYIIMLDDSSTFGVGSQHFVIDIHA